MRGHDACFQKQLDNATKSQASRKELTPKSLLSVFSGAGGMDLGLERAGFESIGCLEIDPDAKETLRTNRGTWLQIGDGDVHEIARYLLPSHLGLGVGELDLLAGGPPCQPFSTAAQWSSGGRRGMSDERAETISAMLDLVERFAPRAVLIENVPGFLLGTSPAISLLNHRIHQMNLKFDYGYRIFPDVLNASEFGVPQNRKRAIVVILRDGIEWKWPNSNGWLGRTATAWDALSDLDHNHLELPTTNGKWADLLPSIPEGWNYQWLTSRGGGEELFGYRTKFWNFLLKLAKDRPSWTLPATPGPASGPFHWDNRPLTIRERLRIQSFPDDWILSGPLRAQSKLVGNATPPLLAEVMGRQLRAALFGESICRPPSLLRLVDTPPPPPRAPEPLPQQYRTSIGNKLPHPGQGAGPAPILRTDK